MLTPERQVLTAVLPFVTSMLLRVLLGRTEFSRWTITLATMWFAINVLLAPYSAGLLADILEFGQHFR
jgi:hypothetical protein